MEPPCPQGHVGELRASQIQQCWLEWESAVLQVPTPPLHQAFCALGPLTRMKRRHGRQCPSVPQSLPKVLMDCLTHPSVVTPPLPWGDSVWPAEGTGWHTPRRPPVRTPTQPGPCAHPALPHSTPLLNHRLLEGRPSRSFLCAESCLRNACRGSCHLSPGGGRWPA